MLERPLSAETLRVVAAEITFAQRSRAVASTAFDALARVVADALLDQAEHRAATVSAAHVDARSLAAGVDASAVTLPSGDALAVLRSGPRSDAERALVAVLLARHLGVVLDRRDGVSALRAMLPSLDWLEFTGQYPPYSAARCAFEVEERARFEDILRASPVEAPTELAAAAVRALRGHVESRPSEAPAGRGRMVSVAGEFEGFERPLWLRVLTVMLSAVTGAARAVLRVVFSLRSPATVSLDGDHLRVVGHTELLGRTLRSYDVRLAVASLTEVRREARYPMLPVAASVCALFIGSTLGAKFMIEGAGGRYWVLVAIGLGLIAAGVLFDFVVRAIFPGVHGRTRLTLRSRDRQGMVLTGLDTRDLDALLDAVEALARPSSQPLVPLASRLTGADAVSAATVRDPDPRRQ